MTTSANAQVFVNPVMPDQWLTSVTTTNAGVPVSSPDDVTLNCDMLNDGKGNAIKAIAWDEGSRSQQGYLYFEDGKGNTTTYKVKGVHPDIVLGDDRDRLGVDYRVAVTYIDPSGYPMLAFYKLIMLGTPSFTVVPLNVIQLSTNAAPGIYDTEPIPHIDMWSDANNPVNGYPGMYEFAVTWTEIGDVKYNWGNITAGSVYLPVGGQLVTVNPPSGSTTYPYRYYCDVACYTNVISGRKYATFCT